LTYEAAAKELWSIAPTIRFGQKCNSASLFSRYLPFFGSKLQSIEILLSVDGLDAAAAMNHFALHCPALHRLKINESWIPVSDKNDLKTVFGRLTSLSIADSGGSCDTEDIMFVGSQLTEIEISSIWSDGAEDLMRHFAIQCPSLRRMKVRQRMLVKGTTEDLVVVFSRLKSLRIIGAASNPPSLQFLFECFQQSKAPLNIEEFEHPMPDRSSTTLNLFRGIFQLLPRLRVLHWRVQVSSHIFKDILSGVPTLESVSGLWASYGDSSIQEMLDGIHYLKNTRIGASLYVLSDQKLKLFLGEFQKPRSISSILSSLQGSGVLKALSNDEVSDWLNSLSGNGNHKAFEELLELLKLGHPLLPSWENFASNFDIPWRSIVCYMKGKTLRKVVDLFGFPSNVDGVWLARAALNSDGLDESMMQTITDVSKLDWSDMSP
jgi:hypothetical protein